MSGGRSALWRASLGSVALALAVVGAGCAVNAGDDAEADTEEAQADLVVGSPLAQGGLRLPAKPVSLPHAPSFGARLPRTILTEVAEPEPEPWHPSSRVGSDQSTPVDTGSTPDPSDDHK